MRNQNLVIAADTFEFSDLSTWQEWSQKQRRVEQGLKRLKSGGRRSQGASSPGEPTLYLPEGSPQYLVVVDKFTPSCAAAVRAPLKYLPPERTAVLAPADFVGGDLLQRHRVEFWSGRQQLPSTVRAVLSLGSYLHLSAEAKVWATERDVPFYLVQHGVLTPWSPPPAPGDHVLAWTAQDADFWICGRSDVAATVVGSQMLWEASGTKSATVTGSDRPIVLGQLHGTELARRSSFATYWDFCRQVPSDYRPHPNEQDLVSRVLHRVMQQGGITFDHSRESLLELGRPVVSIFSTGTLEMAQHGVPAWVYHPEPEDWIRNLWERYGLAEWGGEPTPAWPTPSTEPAAAVAKILESK